VKRNNIYTRRLGARGASARALIDIRGVFKKYPEFSFFRKNIYLFVYINVVPFKVVPPRYNTLMPAFFPIFEALLIFTFWYVLERSQRFGLYFFNRGKIVSIPHMLACRTRRKKIRRISLCVRLIRVCVFYTVHVYTTRARVRGKNERGNRYRKSSSSRLMNFFIRLRDYFIAFSWTTENVENENRNETTGHTESARLCGV